MLVGAACNKLIASIKLLFPTAFGPIRTFNCRSSTVLSLNESNFFSLKRLISICSAFILC